jgi:hypothetical protein
MAVDWRLGLVDSGRNAMDMMTAFETGRKSAMEQNAIRTRDTARQKASTQLATGNTQGAQQTAIAGGDFDFAKAVGSYSDDQRKQLDAEAETLGRFAVGIKSAPREQRKQAFAQSVQALRGKFSPEEIRQRYDELESNGWSDAALDGYVSQAISVKDALAQATRANEQYTLAPGSSRYDARGNLIVAQPFAPQLRSVGAGESLVEIQPGGGGPASTGAGGALSVESVLPHIVAQESGGNYAARNASTGALGAYQVMPATGKTLAERLGLPWRPELMASDSPEARAYQDAVGGAAIQEAVEASGGDPETMAMYYHGGSDRSKWGPKTQQYAKEVTARLGGAAPSAGGSRVVATGAPKQKDPPSGYRWADGSQSRLEPIPGGPGAGKPGGDRKSETDLRKEFNQLPTVKEYNGVRNSFFRIQDITNKKTPSPQDDIALIFSYMKMLDPTSVVREGEFATAQNAGSVPDNIRNIWNKALSGNRLNPAQRNNIRGTARTVYLQQRENYNRVADEYRGYASDYGVDPERVARTFHDAPKRNQQQKRTAPARTGDGQQVTTTIRRIG